MNPEKDHEAMEAIRSGIAGPEMCFYRGICLGYRCGIGPIRDDPADAVLAAKNGEPSNYGEKVSELYAQMKED